ncbi:Protein CBG20640 [Caenorhabditis briggsae]|uniref:glutamine synthetase n=5 Tax=Caenorhabditis TaxID=6237 RepID=A0AAE9IV53_CAEBR|nr:Protein CBG20640 [Caenorhabditis briggsae]PIC47214.1 hypothetical protein B9Z55_006645 [Caenorhabditis nigoni]ULU07264.1 hypothetical protein L3Y34_018790 [Caenorhabditis briggsae]UMM19189.1 hypothetical protein L5515_014908 [Caenorhabditis briggsae]UMM19291.1 hypothetical protein L5515_014959 [Caenorhabditis briggsae]CAP37615.1 Protein CBG20640 [Caenorhabditis briggsae]
MTHLNYETRMPLGQAVIDQFLGLRPHPTKIQATYVWIDGTGENLRSKTRTFDRLPKKIEDYPIWNYDGSSTGQAKGRDSDRYLRPVAAYPDPFLGGANKLVMCDTLDHEMQPTATNHRQACAEIMNEIRDTRPWFGMEQEYLIVDRDEHPLGWPKHGFPAPQGKYYCSVGADRAFGREVVETHYRACLHAGLNIFGTNAEVTPGQWEFQIGTCEGIDMGDQLWMSRYILHRVAEQFGVCVSLDPKPKVTMGDWNGAGCHTNFSTAEMRAPGGIAAIEAAMEGLKRTHLEAMKVYDPHGGEDNLRRLTGRHETSSADKFSWGVANRGCSIRIPRQVAAERKGYLEDRRPSSNCDPYQVTAMIAQSILL